ncbi:hypothetical protein QEZ54_29025 [Catellatospora sp. KI3]|uniref:hypothetical protein n=1 Tax=Catellatospora sp. KI3 TaxID=3041620 RepID=UPI0024823E93|nr:hypothetical protein [Catellatospora sp. KI3]MDI1465020.1 hypothetical protein [Catellatospora sp. KI3]
MSDAEFRVGPGVPMPSDPHFMPPTPMQPRKRRTGLLIGLGAFAAVAVIVGAGLLVWVMLDKTPVGEAAAAVTQSPLEKAARQCANGNRFVTIGDGGKTLMFNTQGEERDGVSITTLECFLRELEVSDAIIAEIDTTRALDGRQTGDWGDYHGSWTYHPDNGLQMIVTMK